MASEIYNPITAVNQPEMSADAHLSHGMSEAHAAMQMPMSQPAQASATQVDSPTAPTYGIPPAVEKANSGAPSMAVSTAAVAPVAAPAPLPTAEPAGNGNVVKIVAGAGNYNSENTYEPKVITVKRGATVTWVNEDPGMVHNLADNKASFQSTYMPTGQSWSYTFKKAGTFDYHCLPHPWMKGTVIVR